jgi:DNA-binding LytR/AlgR family response regulator
VYSCVVIDDDEISSNVLISFIEKTDELVLLKNFNDPISGVNYIKNNPVDVLFLDYEMPNLNGLEVASLLNETNTKIVFTTSHKEIVFDALEYKTIGYLVKPLNYTSFFKTISKLSSSLQNEAAFSNSESIFIKHNKSIVKLNLNDLLCVESNGDYVVLHTLEKDYTIHSTLKTFEESLNFSNFIRVHRSFIININAIVDIEDDTICIKDKIIPIGQKYKVDFYRRIKVV